MYRIIRHLSEMAASSAQCHGPWRSSWLDRDPSEILRRWRSIQYGK